MEKEEEEKIPAMWVGCGFSTFVWDGMGWAGVGDGFSVMFSTFLNDFFNYSNKKINERYLKFLHGVKKVLLIYILYRSYFEH